ncbi:E3 ubiquitin-protein ligase HECTD1 [Symbiodinium microadriaticum]|uniref:E3 ubiquitin-protein ligase HECTD1 n=1 Tax=Symbiodinium microadriaticum TaxID=2951 RepID=A0A1Q9DQY3_SYMMI|nr:E3 ubiquitin-protein ligase HECTD1 [Symbiodinium microadriaticum]
MLPIFCPDARSTQKAVRTRLLTSPSEEGSLPLAQEPQHENHCARYKKSCSLTLEEAEMLAARIRLRVRGGACVFHLVLFRGGVFVQLHLLQHLPWLHEFACAHHQMARSGGYLDAVQKWNVEQLFWWDMDRLMHRGAAATAAARQSSVEALLDIVDDQENRPFLETRRLPPPPPVAREAQQRSRESSREEVPFLQPLELPQPPPPPLAQPFIPVGSAQVDEAIVQQIEHEEPPTPVLAVQEQEMMQMEEETPRFESSSEASGPSHQEEEGHSRGRRAADTVDFDKAIGAPMLEISRIATSLRASEESENKALRLGREDLQEDEEALLAMEAKEAMWLQPPKFQAFPRRAVEKVPLENWFVGYFLETIDAETLGSERVAVGDELATNSFDMESFALPPDTKQASAEIAEADNLRHRDRPLAESSEPSTTASGPSERSLPTPRREGLLWQSGSVGAAEPLEPLDEPPAEPCRAQHQATAAGSMAAAGSSRKHLRLAEKGGGGTDAVHWTHNWPGPLRSAELLTSTLVTNFDHSADEEVLEAFELLAVLWQQAGQVSGLSWMNCKLDWLLAGTRSSQRFEWGFAFMGNDAATGLPFPVQRRRNSLPTELGAATQGDPRKVEELLQEVSNIEVTGERSAEDHADELLLQQEHIVPVRGECPTAEAEAAMERIAPSDRLLEVQFDTETGFGSAVTRSFYAEVARALQNRATNRKVPMWVEAAERRFRFLGRLVGRALKAGELCGTLADFVAALKSGEEVFRRKREEAFRIAAGLGRPPAEELRSWHVENVEEFVELAHAYWCDDGVRGQLTAFREGLDEVIPVECFSAFSALELRDMICGEDSVEPGPQQNPAVEIGTGSIGQGSAVPRWGEQELLDHLRPSGGLTEQSPAYQHLVAVLLDMDQVNRSRFLDFVSSCPRFPPGGIDSFHVDVFPDSTAGRGFPRSRACANQLYLPLRCMVLLDIMNRLGLGYGSSHACL